MKLVMILFILAITNLMASETYSQAAKLTLQVKDATVREVLSKIEEKSEFFFLYNGKLVNVDRKISVDVNDQKIDGILSNMFQGTDVVYVVVDRQIILTNKANQNSFVQPDKQQIQKIAGTVTDETGSPLAGVNIVVEGTTVGAISDVNGKFSINLPGEKTVLVFSFIGYNEQKVSVEGKTTVDVKMVSSMLNLEEVVVVGYGTQKKVDLTGAVTSVKAEKLKEIPSASLTNSLAGRLSGVYVMQTTSVPGISAGLRVRGESSWNGSAPLFIIDGVVMDKTNFDRLDASEVENVTVLKDAASAAIYGSRAAGGVILVTTKKGSDGKPVISYSGSYSFDQPTSFPELMDPVTQGIPYVNKSFAPDHWAYYNPVEVAAATKQGYYRALDDVYKTPNISHHTLNVSGGNEKIKYFIGGSYLDQNGFLPNLTYQKYGLRANVEAKITNDLTASLQIATNYDQRSKFNWNGDSYQESLGFNDLSSLWGWLIADHVFVPNYIDGKPVDTGWVANEEARMKDGYSHYSQGNIDALVTLNYNVPFVKGLSLKVTYSKNNNNGYNKIYDTNGLMYTFAPIAGSNGKILSHDIIGTRYATDPGTEYLANSWNRSSSYQFNGQISFKREFGKHFVDAFVGYEQAESNFTWMNGRHNNFPVVKTDQFWSTSTDVKDLSTDGGESFGARLSYLGRINYTFADKYLFSASLRRDGSLLFAPDKRFGLFPAVSAGWKVSEESFFKEHVSFMDLFKIRASYGVTGNDNVGGWQWQRQYGISQTYILGGQPVRGINSGNMPNPNLTWEKSTSYNYGIDTRFFSKLSFSAEYWVRKTTDILGARNASIPQETGISLAPENYGKVNSHGFELDLGYDGKVGDDFSYSIRVNAAYATNKVILADVAENAPWFTNPNGKTLDRVVGMISTGLIRTQADLDKLPAGFTINGYTPELGMVNYKDISGPDGKPDGKIDWYDYSIVANHSKPSSTGGLNLSGAWKGISLDLFFQGSFGAKKYLEDKMNGSRMACTYGIPWKFWLDSWTPENPNGKYPNQAMEMGTGVSMSNINDSNFWLYDANYIRLKQASLGYTIPKKITKKAGIEALKFTLSGTNLLKWSKYKLYDPELDSYDAYPIMRTITLGLNLTL